VRRADRAETAHRDRRRPGDRARADSAVEERAGRPEQLVFDAENRLRSRESQVDFKGREARDLEERASAARGEIDAWPASSRRRGSNRRASPFDAERFRRREGGRAAELESLEQSISDKKRRSTSRPRRSTRARAEIGRRRSRHRRARTNARSLERGAATSSSAFGRMADEESGSAVAPTSSWPRRRATKPGSPSCARPKAERDGRRAELEARNAGSPARCARSRRSVKRLEAILGSAAPAWRQLVRSRIASSFGSGHARSLKGSRRSPGPGRRPHPGAGRPRDRRRGCARRSPRRHRRRQPGDRRRRRGLSQEKAMADRASWPRPRSAGGLGG